VGQWKRMVKGGVGANRGQFPGAETADNALMVDVIAQP